MKGSGSGPDGPEDVDAVFAEIVADLEREGLGTDVPTDPGESDSRRDTDPAETADGKKQADEQANEAGNTAWRGHDADFDWSWGSEDEHYVPPEPPPLPRPRPVTVVALALLLIGVLLLVAPGLLTLPARVATPIALISLAVGIGLTVLRIRQRPPNTDRDDGAQL